MKCFVKTSLADVRIKDALMKKCGYFVFEEVAFGFCALKHGGESSRQKGRILQALNNMSQDT